MIFNFKDTLFNSGKEKVVRVLLRNGADVNSRERDDWTPLHLVAQNGSVQIAEILIQNNATVDAQNKLGKSPLHLAAYFGKFLLCLHRFFLYWFEIYLCGYIKMELFSNLKTKKKNSFLYVTCVYQHS